MEIFLRANSKSITIRVFATKVENGLVVIKKIRAYHTTSHRGNHWWASYHDRPIYTKKVIYGVIFLKFSEISKKWSDEFIIVV